MGTQRRKVVDSRVSVLSSRDEVRVGNFRCGGATPLPRSNSRIPGSIGWEAREPRDELSSLSVQQPFAGFDRGTMITRTEPIDLNSLSLVN